MGKRILIIFAKYISASKQACEEVLQLLQTDRLHKDKYADDNAWNLSNEMSKVA